MWKSNFHTDFIPYHGYNMETIWIYYGFSETIANYIPYGFHYVFPLYKNVCVKNGIQSGNF
jgi:hypothetical protein